ncbi:MAG: LuxR C-terminal-related transcriptional regulator [Chloroflexota bacterium]
MVLANQTATSMLVSELWSQVRALADQREVDLDLRLLGKPGDISSDAREILSRSMNAVLQSAFSAGELHHLALELTFQADALSARIEHDGTIDPVGRSATEQEIFSHYTDIGAMGGSLSLSSGRGFGLRVELTLPFASNEAASNTLDRYQEPPRGRPTPAVAVMPALHERLTPQEEVALSLLSAGLSNKEIAAHMNLGVGTVKFHLAQIYQKLGVQGRGRGAAVARARELGLLFD